MENSGRRTPVPPVCVTEASQNAPVSPAHPSPVRRVRLKCSALVAAVKSAFGPKAAVYTRGWCVTTVTCGTAPWRRSPGVSCVPVIEDKCCVSGLSVSAYTVHRALSRCWRWGDVVLCAPLRNPPVSTIETLTRLCLAGPMVSVVSVNAEMLWSHVMSAPAPPAPLDCCLSSRKETAAHSANKFRVTRTAAHVLGVLKTVRAAETRKQFSIGGAVFLSVQVGFTKTDKSVKPVTRPV